ncbi:hypothetical protein NSK_007724 [Nannochloropsis salina CCMP1776]|uniref:TauD/TfdA-like domain-containing protein n=1 Tax=Nannochloropsis salina CCMP1776 TaxID=1027361 RepID=A0A4D9CPI8_9STRA|nr:hypothetical protein NSK_007724 [Nannochloropsis salina CCMP1776]|eukprot:TFJ81081.1 hypothetical protein NSK_007724 [Nannochloropsis salina CCMP1776]
MRTLTQVLLHEQKGIVEVSWQDGTRGLFHGAWLRDNCPVYFDNSTGQRTKNTLQLGPEAYVLSACAAGPAKGQLSSGVSAEFLQVTWKDGFSHAFPSAWLRQHCYETRQHHQVNPRMWGRDLVSYFPGYVLPTLPYSDVVKVAAGSDAGWQTSAQGFVQWMVHLRDYGVALIEDVPTTPGTVMKMADLIAYHRKTHYGNSFQVVSARKPEHLAYTPVELEVHTDLNYRESSPGIQLLHCLAADAAGGESTFVDGFWVAETLRRESAEDYRTLCEVPIPFLVKDGEGFHYHKIPTICLDDAGRLVEIHFNERTRGPLELPAAVMGRVYRALAHFQAIACRPELCVEVKMKAGDMVAFNNRRILHGRKAFDPRTGMRHLEGTYVDMDEFLTCLRKHGVTPLSIVRAQEGSWARVVEGTDGLEEKGKRREPLGMVGMGGKGKGSAPRSSL